LTQCSLIPTSAVILPDFSVRSRGSLGSGREAYSAISGVIYAIETLEEGISIDEVKASTEVRTDLFGSD
jgi:hypothetical protein